MIREFQDINEVIRLLTDHQIHIGLLLEFIEEALESQLAFNALAEKINNNADADEYKSLEELKRFSALLKQANDLQSHQSLRFYSELERRAAMMDSVDKFLALLNK